MIQKKCPNYHHFHSLSGVNVFQEEASRSFDNLSTILEKLKPQLDKNDYESCKFLINGSKTYLKTQYNSHLSHKAEVRSHCTTCALTYVSQSYPTEFDGNCEVQHSKRCRNCELLYELFDVFDGLLNDPTITSNFTPHECDIMIKRLEDAKDDISEYQRFIVRNHRQNAEWDKLFDSNDTTQAMLTMDWVS